MAAGGGCGDTQWWSAPGRHPPHTVHSLGQLAAQPWPGHHLTVVHQAWILHTPGPVPPCWQAGSQLFSYPPASAHLSLQGIAAAHPALNQLWSGQPSEALCPAMGRNHSSSMSSESQPWGRGPSRFCHPWAFTVSPRATSAFSFTLRVRPSQS